MWKLNWNVICGIFAAFSAGVIAVLLTSAAKVPVNQAVTTPASVSYQTVPTEQNIPRPLVLGTDAVTSTTPVRGTYGRPVDIPGVTPTYGAAENYSEQAAQTKSSEYGQAQNYYNQGDAPTETYEQSADPNEGLSQPNYDAPSSTSEAQYPASGSGRYDTSNNY